MIETPLLRVDTVDERKVRVPKRVRVSAGMSGDGIRRAQIAAINKKVVTVTWNIKTTEKGGKSTTVVTLRGKGVRACTVFLREPTFQPGQSVTVKVRSKTVWRKTLAVDPRHLLQEARRTGERLRPALVKVPVRL